MLRDMFVRQMKFANRLNRFTGIPVENCDEYSELLNYHQKTDEAIKTVQENAQAIIMEGAELLDWTPWKHWSQKSGNKMINPDEMMSGSHIEEMRIELADITCFLINACMALGMDADTLNDYHRKKMEINHGRQDTGTY